MDKMMKKKGYAMGGKMKAMGMKKGGNTKGGKAGGMTVSKVRAMANKMGYKLVKK